MSDLNGKLMKSLMLIHPQWTEEFMAFVEERKFPGVRFVPTNPHLIEMLPEQSSKGNALEKLMEMKKIDRSRLVAIGDYYNDKEMIELAGIGVTMHTAPEDLKALAELLVCDCEEGSLGDLIEQLEARYP
jgi:hydroxymethylpyrimidine pyrophosphatase-like HAD family hydrolase